MDIANTNYKFRPKCCSTFISIIIFKIISEAYGNEVIFIAGINVKFYINLKAKEIVCPICSKNFIPNTLGFWKCEYQIKGEKLKDGEYIPVNINGKETKDIFY